MYLGTKFVCFVAWEDAHGDDGRLSGSSNPSEESVAFRLLLSQGNGGSGWGKRWLNRDPRKIVLSLLTLVSMGLVRRLLQIFYEQYILPLSPWVRHFLIRGCFYKTQGTIRISPKISMPEGHGNKAGFNKRLRFFTLLHDFTFPMGNCVITALRLHIYLTHQFHLQGLILKSSWREGRV